MVHYKTLSSEEKIQVIQRTNKYKAVNNLNVHNSIKARELKKHFNISLLECSKLFN